MSNLPALKPKKLLAILQKSGWFISRQKGSHIQLKHNTKPGFRVTIPFHNEDLAPGTLSSIIRQMGISKQDFENLISKS